MKTITATSFLLILLAFSSCEEKITCKNCNGKGTTWWGDYKECGLCHGSGKTTKSEEEKYFN
jgi:DnaJ-class molecular chaperone